jgi:4-hydroxy-tetrahydrodipicolinate reductase
VVTSCENLADPELALAQLEPGFEQRVRDSGLVVLATGVNPGFAMDRLPVMLTQATRNIRRVRVVRVVNASTRRAQLQAKIGVGMTPHDFVESIKRGEIGHAGLSASLRLLAKGLGITLEKTSEAFTPIIAEAATNSSVLGPVKAGAVRGIYQIARGYRARREVITLELTMALDEPNPRDTIDIVGEPPLHFEGELPGDLCTVATMLSAISVVVTMPPGLRTVLDVPLEQPEEPVASKEPLVASRTRGATQLPQRAGEGRRLKGATVESKKPPRPEASGPETKAKGTAGPKATKKTAKAKSAKAKPTKAQAKAKPKEKKRTAKGRTKGSATARADARDAHVASTGAPQNGASEKEHERGAQPTRVMTKASVKRERNAHASTNGVARKKQT